MTAATAVAMSSGAGARSEDQLSSLQLYNVDYSPWQRHKSPSTSCQDSHHLVSLISSAGQKPCHLRPSDKQRLAAANAAKLAAVEQLAQNEQGKLLRVQILTKKQMLEESLRRETEILEANFELKDMLELNEKQAHESIKLLLRKYERFRGGLGNISGKFTTELGQCQDEMDETRQQMNAEILKLETELRNVDNLLHAKQSQLQVLRSYVDKEKPMKALQIADLKRKIDLVRVEHEKEVSELQRIVELDKDKTEKMQQRTRDSIRSTVAKNAVQKMESSIEEIAQQNKQLTQEICVHEQEIRRLEETNRQLTADVKQMLRDPRTNVRQMMFPELFAANMKKCTPDIPTQEWLPI